MTIPLLSPSVHLDNISRPSPDHQGMDRDSQHAAFDHLCGGVIPYLRTNGYSWGGFADFSPAAVDWLRANQAIVRADKSQFKRQRTPKQQANEAWASLTR